VVAYCKVNSLCLTKHHAMWDGDTAPRMFNIGARWGRWGWMAYLKELNVSEYNVQSLFQEAFGEKRALIFGQ